MGVTLLGPTQLAALAQKQRLLRHVRHKGDRNLLTGRVQRRQPNPGISLKSPEELGSSMWRGPSTVLPFSHTANYREREFPDKLETVMSLVCSVVLSLSDQQPRNS